jgi:hypothetical protein
MPRVGRTLEARGSFGGHPLFKERVKERVKENGGPEHGRILARSMRKNPAVLAGPGHWVVW